MRIRKTYFLILLLLTACHKAPLSPKDPCTQFEGSALSIPYHVFVGKQLSAAEHKKVEAIIQKTFSEIDLLFNHLNPDSEISRLNTAPAETLIPLSPPLQDLFSLCDRLVALSGGRFDPTVEPLERVWSESLDQNKIPAASDLQVACEALGWNHITVKNGIFRKDHPETRIDFRGISKGLCIDWIMDRLQAIGYSDLFIEWAGQMRASGQHPVIGDWVVQVNPHLTSEGRPFAPIPLRNSAIAMSGDFAQKGRTLQADQSPDGQMHRYFHIIDPLTAQPLETTSYSIASAIVIAPTCALADALATAAMLFPGRKEAEAWAQEVVDLHPDVSFWILSHGKK